MSEELRAPFPWPGGKSRVAEVAWRALGPDVVNYVEPCFGSGAMLLGRPGGAGKIETVNDLDGGIVNFYRAIQHAPDEVAEWCNWPVSELDLHARHAWLVVRLAELADQLRADPDFYCAKTAGWWVWGICQWIGTGWCQAQKPHASPHLSTNGSGNGPRGVFAPTNIAAEGTADLPHQRPHISGDSAGMGVLKQQLPELALPARAKRTSKGVLSQQLPSLRVDSGATGNGILASGKMLLLSTNGQSGSKGVMAEGLWQQIPALAVPSGQTSGGTGQRGVHAEGLPAIGNDRGINGVAAPPCQAWFRALQERLRRVRIVCGDWKRVLGNSVLGKGKNVGGRRPCAVFLDPPYDVSMRAKRIYGHDQAGLSAEVRAWALKNGADPDLRIVLCGYADEHAELLQHGWRAHGWKGARGYAAADNDNRENETLFLSPHCLDVDRQRSLFQEIS